MTGLLQRLAGQALGESAGVRPRARTRFADPAATPHGEVAALDPSLEIADRPMTRSPLEIAPVTREVTVARGDAERSTLDFRRADSARTVPLQANAPDAQRPAQRPAPPLLMPLREASQPSGADAISTTALRPEPRDAAVRPTLHATLHTASAPGESRDEPSEVHVHIGRIEVTAVHEPPRKRESSARAPASTRLEEYLRPRGAR